MGIRLRIRGCKATAVRGVLDRVLNAHHWSLCKAKDDGSQLVRIVPLDEGVRVEWDGLVRSLAAHVAEAFVAEAATAQLADCTIPAGSRGDVVYASGVNFQPDGAHDLDLQADAEEILADWMREGTAYDEDEVELELCNELLGGTPRGNAKNLHVRRTQPAKLARIVTAVRNGASLEWTELSGRPAVRISEVGASQITVLSAEERSELEVLLEDGS